MFFKKSIFSTIFVFDNFCIFAFHFFGQIIYKSIFFIIFVFEYFFNHFFGQIMFFQALFQDPARESQFFQYSCVIIFSSRIFSLKIGPNRRHRSCDPDLGWMAAPAFKISSWESKFIPKRTLKKSFGKSIFFKISQGGVKILVRHRDFSPRSPQMVDISKYSVFSAWKSDPIADTVHAIQIWVEWQRPHSKFRVGNQSSSQKEL